MTIRAVVLGLLGAAAICAVTYFNDAVIRQTQFTGNNFPFSVYGTLILFLLVVNPLLAILGRRFPGRRCAFTGGELAVMLTLTLAACCIPGSALMRSFPSTMMIPHHAVRTDPGWREEEVVRLAPANMLAGTPPRLRPDDVLDPRGLCLAMMRDGEGEATGPPSRVGGRIWGFLSGADREAIKEAAKRARAGPDGPARERAEAAVARLLEEELERAREELKNNLERMKELKELMERMREEIEHLKYYQELYGE